MLSRDELKAGLRDLDPATPWAHHFDLGNGVETVTPDNEQFYRKAVGLKKLGDMVRRMVPYHTRQGTLKGLRALDLACAEGAHSIEMAREHADVVGIEGRELYVRRARFVSHALGIQNVRFEQGDVRRIDAARMGRFDLVLFSGILHHLGQEDFDGMVRQLAALTGDTLVLYTHISAPASIKRFNLTGPTRTPKGYEGYLFREHKDNADKETRLKQVRASLDNTFSFWATEESLVRALNEAGFVSITKFLSPHIFGWEEAQIRPIIVARMPI